MKKIEISKGNRFGKLTVISELPKPIKRRTFECKCDCGKSTTITLQALRKKGVSSCGCYQDQYNNSEKPERRSENFGHVGTRIYTIWGGMKKRCSNKKSRAYKWYGAKGVNVCKDWKNRFMNFYNWANDNGYKENLTIDRIDPYGNYEPSNCRWIPLSEQNKMKDNRRVLYKGEKISCSELSRLTNTNYSTLIGRLNRGLTVKEAIL
jgi:hypothetical protein